MAKALYDLSSIRHVRGYCWMADVSLPPALGDSAAEPMRSSLKLLEDGVAIGPAHSVHDLIAERGLGAFSHWASVVYFSSSDGSHPNENGRTYSAILTEHLSIGSWAAVAPDLEALPHDPDPRAVYAAIETCLARLYPEAVLGEDMKQFWRAKDLRGDYEHLVGSNMRSFERKFALANIAKLIRTVSGDIVECGAYEGASVHFIAKGLDAAHAGRTFHLFDSFEGLSEPGPQDGDYWSKGALSTSEAKARSNLSWLDDVRTYRGWIPDRFIEVADARVAMLHIDVDLYEPTLKSLDFFYPRVTSGGIIVCDDYGFASCPGAMLAVETFFADKPEPIVHLPTGQALVIKR